MQRTTGTVVSRKPAVAPVSRPLARPFTAQRPFAVAARDVEASRARGVVVRAAAAAESPSANKAGETKVRNPIAVYISNHPLLNISDANPVGVGGAGLQRGVLVSRSSERVAGRAAA
jgi:hypothetical protein